MNDLPRQQIMALIDKYGPDVLDMSQTMASELHLACPGHSAEVEGLVAALRHGVVHYLLVLAEAGKFATSDLPAQVQRLHVEASLPEAEAERAVHTWAEIVGTIHPSLGGERPWRREPRALHRQRFFGLGYVLIVGMAGLSASMLPWLFVLEEKRGRHFSISAEMDLLGAHALLNLLGAAGGFLGGALGWMLGTPRSLEFQVSGGLASAHRVIAASLAAAFGSFFGLWIAYHHFADIGAFFGPLLGAGIGAFLAAVYTFTYRRMGAWNK
jgi:hypothetical protein